MTDLAALSAEAIAKEVRGGTLSAREVTEAAIARHEAVNPAINAVVETCHEAARTTAAALDAAIADGVDPGPLAGVPVTTKVNVDQAGCATTNGLRLQENQIADEDSPLVANLRKAGAIIVGRTNTPAFSLRWFTKNQLHGQTLNPRNSGITPGGSSGGAAAGVAAGLSAIGHGTDIAGSIRYPAYACGVQGLRPTLGRVPAYNATAGDRYIGAQVMAVSGPIARSVRDLELGFHAMGGLSPRDPLSLPAPGDLPETPRRATLCLTPDGMTVAPEIKAALTSAAMRLEGAGWQVDEGECPPMREPAEINGILWMAETMFAAPDAMRDEADPDAQFVFDQMVRAAGRVDLEAVMTALKRRVTLIRLWEEFFETSPLLLCPNSGELPFEQQLDVRSEADFARIYEAQLTQRGLPVIGMPAMSIATGQSEGRPLGVQLVSARFREDLLFEAGTIIEAGAGAPSTVDPR